MKIARSKTILLFCFFLILSLSGCASKLLMPFATWVQIDFQSDADINPDDSGRASPVVVRLYELKDASSFQSKEFFAIYDNDSEALGGSLVNKEEFNFRPDETSYVERKLKEDTEYIGVFVAFRDLDDATWRAHYKLRKNRTNRLKVTIKGVKVNITSIK